MAQDCAPVRSSLVELTFNTIQKKPELCLCRPPPHLQPRPYTKMSVDRDTILNSMQSYIKSTRDHMSVQPQRLAEAAECMHEVRIIHETLMIFDNQLGPDLIAYLNMVD